MIGDHEDVCWQILEPLCSFLVSGGFHIGTTFAHYVWCCWITNTDFNWGSEACSVLVVVVLSWFVTCCIGGQCAVRVILVGQPLFRWFTTVPGFLSVCTVCTMALSHPESYKWLCKPFQTEICQCLCFSFILEIHEFVAWCACSWELLAYFTLSNRFCLSDFLIQDFWQL